jgi:hypothetical protein
VLLGENADRWLLSESSAVTSRVLSERTELERERAEVECELRLRTAGERSAEAHDDEQLRLDQLEEEAARYEGEAIVQELAASFFDARGFRRPAARHRRHAEVMVRLAEDKRAEAARARDQG